jgi:glycosyltransferase involved in cell wall biosynthesis
VFDEKRPKALPLMNTDLIGLQDTLTRHDTGVEEWPHRFARLTSGMKVALVHDWLTCYAGSERVLEQLISVFPDADLFSLVDFVPEHQRAFLKGKRPVTTFLQKCPGKERTFRKLLPLMPLAIESLDLSAYDIVISSSHAVAKGVLTGPQQLHICYCHTPMRYAWDLQAEYLNHTKSVGRLGRMVATLVLHYMRLWDTRTTNGVDTFIANSHYVASRIRKTYGRSSVVLHPPVDTDRFEPCGDKGGYYLTASRLVPYKRVRLIVEAFTRMPDRTLLVIGSGPELDSCMKAAGPNVRFLDHVPAAELVQYMQRAKAFVYAADEDFGIVMAEAQACGTPVICYSKGGARDIVAPGRTGLWFHHQSSDAIQAAVEEFESASHAYHTREIRAHATRFGHHAFRHGLYAILRDSMARGQQRAAGM